MSSIPQTPAQAASASVYSAYQGNTYLFGGNAPYVEEMYENYLANPGSVLDAWREYFDALQHVAAAVFAAGTGHMLERVEILAPVVGHRGGVVQIVLVQLFDIGRVAAEEIGIGLELFHHGAHLFRVSRLISVGIGLGTPDQLPPRTVA